MKVQIFSLLILLSVANVMCNSKDKEKEKKKEKEKEKECSDFSLECWFESWFGEDSSSEEDSSEESLSQAVSKLSNTIQKTLFDQGDSSFELPYFPTTHESGNEISISTIISYLENLTRVLKNLSSPSHSAGSNQEFSLLHTNLTKVSSMSKLMDTLSGRIQNLERGKLNSAGTKANENEEPPAAPADDTPPPEDGR